MSRLPASHNDSFARLLAEGYVLYRRGPYVVGKVPFLDAHGGLREGLLVDVLNLGTGGMADRPSDHRFYFSGGVPHKLDGTPINLGGEAKAIDLFDGVESTHWTSFKMAVGQPNQNREYVDFFEKFKSYFGLISAPAKERYPDYELTPFVDVENEDPDNPFVFDDTHAARAQINELREKLSGDHVAIIGVGGSGGYVLDYLSKSPVGEISIFDDDDHNVHNSFRSPGPTVREDLGRKKVDLQMARYEHAHKRVNSHNVRLDNTNQELLDGTSFAFVCVDNVKSRQMIARILLDRGIPFIDVGMGLNRGPSSLLGMLRVTFSRPGSEEKVRTTLIKPEHHDLDDAYRTNIQTVELNALGAALAVMMYKKFRGYYEELPRHWQLLITVASNSMVRFEL